jgi:site-specific recombinase XerD
VVEGGADAKGYVWPGKDGEPMAAKSPLQALRRAQVRIGLVDADGKHLVTFHGLRHTAASVMLAHGVPLIVVSRQLGQANAQITADTYAHLLRDEQLDQAAAVFDRTGSGTGIPGHRVAAPVAAPPAGYLPGETGLPATPHQR